MSRSDDVFVGFIVLFLLGGMAYGTYYAIIGYPEYMRGICINQFDYDGFQYHDDSCYRAYPNGSLELTVVRFIGGKYYLDGSSFYRSR